MHHARGAVMTTTTIPGLEGQAPPDHAVLLAWIAEVAAPAQPDRVAFADGAEAGWNRPTAAMAEARTSVKLNEDKLPNSRPAQSHPKAVARVESRTFICSATEQAAGPTNPWRDPA